MYISFGILTKNADYDTIYKMFLAILFSACIKTYLWFFSNVVFLNYVYSHYPPFPEGEGDSCGDFVPAPPVSRG